MTREEFSTIRRHLGKTQLQMAQLLGTSLKAVESYEQGLRNIPAHIERQVLFLLVLKILPHKKSSSCWVIRKCPKERRKICPAWELQAGNLCWIISGTICQGKVQKNWQNKMKVCRKCEVFQGMLPI